MQNEAKYTLVDFTPEEAKTVLNGLDAVLVKYKGQFAVTPVINPNGTIGAKVEVFKKVQLVPKAEGFPSPFIPDAGPTPEIEAA